MASFTEFREGAPDVLHVGPVLPHAEGGMPAHGQGRGAKENLSQPESRGAEAIDGPEAQQAL